MFDARSFRSGGEKIFIHRSDGESISYAEASDRIDEIVAELNDCERTLCLFFFENDVDSVFTYLALMRADCVPVPLPSDLGPTSIADFVSAYGCELIAGRNELLSDFEGQVRSRVGSVAIKSLATSERRDPIAKDCALLLATSGSTGDMKSVRLSLQNIRSVSSSIAKYLQLSSKDVLATSLPFFYSYGLSVLHTSIYCHASLSVARFSLLDKEYWRQLSLHKVSVFSAVPAMLDNLSKLGLDRLIPPSLRILTVAGGRLSKLRTEEYLEFSSKFGFSLFSMYGATEASPRMSYVPPEKALEKIGSAGIAIPGGTFSIDTRESDNDGEGEVIYVGPNVALGYAVSRSDLNRNDDFKGCLHTGDVGYLDDEGFLYLTGRIKRISKQQGIRLNLDHVESILSDHGIDSMAIDLDGRLVVAIAESSVTGAQEVFRSVVSRVVKFRVLKIDSFPYSANGKKDYKALMNELTAGRA